MRITYKVSNASAVSRNTEARSSLRVWLDAGYYTNAYAGSREIFVNIFAVKYPAKINAVILP